MRWPLVLLASFIVSAGPPGHGPRARGEGLPSPPTKAASLWNRPGRLAADGFPTAAGMSFYWGARYREVPSAVTVYPQGGNGKRWPDDRYQLLGPIRGNPRAPAAVVLERVAAPLGNPLAGLANGVAQLAPGLVSVSHQRQYQSGVDTVWVDATRLRGGKPAKARLLQTSGISPFLALALKARTNFYRVAVVERPVAGGEDVALGVFIRPSGNVRGLLRLVNSLPAGPGGVLNLIP